MLTIRKQQFAVFQKAASEEFEARMMAHIQKFFPHRMAELGEASVRDLIRYGIERAASYRISQEPEVCKYIGIMVVFGRDFDRDPQLPWASAILREPNFPSSSVRVTELHKAAVAALRPKGTDDGGSRSS
jgi:hypothetical protein